MLVAALGLDCSPKNVTGSYVAISGPGHKSPNNHANSLPCIEVGEAPRWKKLFKAEPSEELPDSDVTTAWAINKSLLF